MNAHFLSPSVKPCRDLGVLSVVGYAFFSVLPYATAGRYICSGLMLIAVVIHLVRRQFVCPKLTWINLSVYALLAVALLSTAVSTDPGDSFKVVRKDMLPFLLGFLLLTSVPRDKVSRENIIVMTCGAVILAYAFRTIMALWVDLETGFRFSFYKVSPELPRYLDFYAADALYYTPFLFAAILFADISRKTRAALCAVFAVLLFEVGISGVRTSFVLVSFTMLIMLAGRYWQYRKYMLLALSLSALAIYTAKDFVTNPTLARYYTLVDPKTYQFGKDFSVSERTAIASAVMQISEQRPLLGYGPGWAKLPTVAEQLGMFAEWQTSQRPIDQMKYNYFALGEGRVNPHNLYLSIFFELGALGVATYISLLLSLLAKALAILRQPLSPTGKAVAFASVCYVTVYLIAGFTGGPWAPATLMVLLGAIVLLEAQPHCESGHDV